MTQLFNDIIKKLDSREAFIFEELTNLLYTTISPHEHDPLIDEEVDSISNAR
jgi:hypothetical protein